MNGTEIVIDTNICIYLLSGDAVLAEMLQDQNIYISIITEMELCAYKGADSQDGEILKDFLDAVFVININENVKSSAIDIRKSRKLKLPDCIVAASALANNFPLITADQSFKKIEDLDLIFYSKI